MRYITDPNEIELTKHYLELAAIEATYSKCKKSQRGVIIIKNDIMIGKGHNKPTLENLCCMREEITDNGRVELCTAIHAEQMAMIDAANHGFILNGGRMYHIKTKKGQMVPSGEPSCTVCSRLIYEAGLEFVLWHKEGYAIYDPKELNELSYRYFLKQ